MLVKRPRCMPVAVYFSLGMLVLTLVCRSLSVLSSMHKKLLRLVGCMQPRNTTNIFVQIAFCPYTEHYSDDTIHVT